MYTLKIVAHDESIRLPPESLNHLRSTRILKNPPELLICSYVRGLLSTFADTLRHGAPSALQQRTVKKWYFVGVSSRAVVVVQVNGGLLGQLSRAYITSIFARAAVDPVAVRLYGVPLSGNTIERSDLSLTTTPVGHPSRLWPFLVRVGRENDASGGLARVQH